MDDKKNTKERSKEWWNKHKKKVIIVAGVLVTTISGYLFVKNWDDISKFLSGTSKMDANIKTQMESTGTIIEKNSEPLEDVVETTKEVYFKLHIMNLPDWKNASPEAIARAQELGIHLEDHQTIRGPGVRNIAA